MIHILAAVPHLPTFSTPPAELWKLVHAFKEKYQLWMYGPLFAFDLEELETSVPAWTKVAARLAKDLRGPPQG
jgi:hypothetical protein